MRSQVPKVLHDLCGLPMLLWPLRAAAAAGAERIVVVDSPARALREVLPDGVELAVQERPDGTGGAVAAALAALGGDLDDGAAVLVLSGDVPLVSAEALARAARRAPRRWWRCHDGDHGARGPERLRAGGSRPRRGRRTGRRDQAPGRLDPGRARDPRGQHGHLRLPGRAAARRAAPPGLRERPGRAVPAAGARAPPRRRCRGRRAPDRRSPSRAGSQRPCRAGRGPCRGPAGHPPAPHACGRDDRGSCRDRDRCRRRDRRGHRRGAVHEHPRRDAHRARVPCAPLLPARLRAGGRSLGRPVRLPAPWHGPARRSEGGHLRGGQELGHRPGLENPAPLLHRRRRRRRPHEPRRGHDHGQLRRSRQAPHDDRRRRQDERRHDARRARDRRRRRLHGCRLRHHRGRTAGSARDRPCPAGQQGGLPRARRGGRGCRRRGRGCAGRRGEAAER